MLVPQRLDHEIEGALPPEQLEIGLELLRGPGLHRLALGGHDRLCGLVREDLRVGLADELFGRKAGGRVVHPGKAHLLVLAEHGDGRAAERDLDALLRLGQFLGARLDAFFKLMPRPFKLSVVCKCAAISACRRSREGTRSKRGATHQRRSATAQASAAPATFRIGAAPSQTREPKREERDQMRKADRDHEQRAERDHGHHVRTIPASLAPDDRSRAAAMAKKESARRKSDRSSSHWSPGGTVPAI